MSSSFRNNELLFPHLVVPTLAEVRNGSWAELVRYVATLDETNEESLAFSLMMIQLCGCLKCQPGCYKLSLGCGTCASRAVASFKGSDATLLRRYRKSVEEVRGFLTNRTLVSLTLDEDDDGDDWPTF